MVVKPSKHAAVSLQVTTVLIFCMHHIAGLPNLGDYILSSSLRIALRFCSLLAKVAEEGAWSAFPVTIILMEWLSSQSRALHIICTEKTLGIIFSEFCERVAALDMFILNKNMDNDLNRNSQLSQQDNISRPADKAQWEDHELLGFVPLASTHLRLDFSSPLPGYGVFDLTTYSCWKLRYSDALQKLGKSVGNGLCGCPDLRHINFGTEESNENPSLREWIEKTFFSVGVLSDLAHSKKVEAQCIAEGGDFHNQVVSSSEHDRENANLHDQQRSSKSIVDALLFEASTKMIVQSDEVMDHCNSEPAAVTEPLALARATLKLNDDLPTAANPDKVENALGIGSKSKPCDVGCGTTPPEYVASDLPNQSLPGTETDKKLPDMDKEANRPLSSTVSSLQDLSGNHVGSITHSQNQQPIPNVLCIDSITHAKPRELMEALQSSKLRSCINPPVGCNLSPLMYNGQSNWDKNAYETQNPFVLRLRRMFGYGVFASFPPNT